MQNRRGGSSLKSASLVSVACIFFLGAGFLIGRHVGLDSCGSRGQASPNMSDLLSVSSLLTSSGSGDTHDAGTFRMLGPKDSSSVSTSSKLKPLYWPPEGSSGRIPPICLNTCSKARNGVCDEGRTKEGAPPDRQSVFCDLGTDCDDCGPWTPTTQNVPWAKDGRGGPISRLMDRQVEVRVRHTNLAPLDFVFAYTDPKKDVDVSAHMDSSGYVELENSAIFYKVFTSGCRRPDGSRGLFLDVGSNFGWFAVMAASLGCRVVAFEPVPHFHAFLEYNLHVNGLAHLVDVRRLIVSAESGVSLNMTVPSQGIWGTAGIGGLNIDRAIQSTYERISVPSIRLEDLVKEPALLMKMDVEGWEFAVFDGALNVIKQHGIENIILEYSPGVPERSFRYDELELTVRMVDKMLAHKYSILQIKDGGPDKNLEFSVPLTMPLPPMKEVTAANIQYDIADVAKFKVRRLGCSPSQTPDLNEHGRHKALAALEPGVWSMCNSVPEDLNPRSLRSVMGHNTNLWASRNRGMMPLSGPVGLVPPTAPASQYFPEAGAVWGLGRRLCQDIPPRVQVRHRCRCTNVNECGKQETEVSRLSERGSEAIASNYVLP